MIKANKCTWGFTLIEMLIAVTVGAILLAGLYGVVSQTLQTQDAVHQKNILMRDARFAMQRMTRSVRHTRLLMLPMNDKVATNWPENIREETVPASTPIGDSTKATAVLAVTLPLYSDLNSDGFPDADDDKDGKIDEDLPNDRSYDFASGIYLIDDDGDGSVDENSQFYWDDDEFWGVYNEDPIDGIDNDGDGLVDEDNASDMNGDGCPGICGVDDDADGTVDEGDVDDDDEDGNEYEDWYNPVVYYLDNGTLKERTPVPWDTNADSTISGLDFITSDIAENVTLFRIERISKGSNQDQLVDIIIELTSPVTGEKVTLQTQVRVGSAM